MPLAAARRVRSAAVAFASVVVLLSSHVVWAQTIVNPSSIDFDWMATLSTVTDCRTVD
jgi:hypothetical protein